MKMRVIIVLTIILSFTCCKKDDSDLNYFNNLQGTWINIESDFDALIFKNDTILDRKYLKTNLIQHHYRVKIESDSIIIKYTGIDKINVLISKKRYILNSTLDTLTIDSLSQYYPYIIGNKFYKLKIK